MHSSLDARPDRAKASRNRASSRHLAPRHLATPPGFVILNFTAPVAQRIESRTSNPKVVGSNPTGRAFLSLSEQQGCVYPILGSVRPTGHPRPVVYRKWRLFS